MDQKPTILVVDDEQVILDAAHRILAAEGFVVHTALDGETGLALLDSHHPEIVITDLMLPGISGVEFLERARQSDPDQVVIVTTGYSTVDNAVDCLKRGAFDFLPKPFASDEVLSPVQRAVRYLQLPPEVRKRLRPPAEKPAAHCLGLQTWARFDEDAVGVLGVTELFLRTVDRIDEIVLPERGHELRQGGRLASIGTEGGFVHEVWSPLSGRVLMVNELLAHRPDLPHQDPVDAAWLVRVMPLSPEADLANLHGRPE